MRSWPKLIIVKKNIQRSNMLNALSLAISFYFNLFLHSYLSLTPFSANSISNGHIILFKFLVFIIISYV